MDDQLPIGIQTLSLAKGPEKDFYADVARNVFAEPVKSTVKVQIKTLEQLEIEHIEHALELFKNNKAQVAIALGITTKTLYNKLHAYNLFDKYKGTK